MEKDEQRECTRMTYEKEGVFLWTNGAKLKRNYYCVIFQ